MGSGKKLAFKPTEQQLACEQAFKLNKFLTIQALSGTGKSSTLQLLAEGTNDLILYLAFNKAMAEEARKKMPKNVECRTLHSICYQFLPDNLRYKLTRPEGAYVNVAFTGSEIAKKFNISNIIDNSGKVLVTRAMIGLMVKQTLSAYEFSDDENIGRQHFPRMYLHDLKKKGVKESTIVTSVISYAKKLWRARIDPKDVTMMSHDTYVKLFQLSKRDLGYDMIFGDEFQDVNPAFLDILKNAKRAKKIVVVGDEFQSIYQFRGSQNMMHQTSQMGAECYLTACFRFGPAVAKVANLILNMDGKKPVELVGKGGETEVGGPSSSVVDYSKPYTMIFRKNLSLLIEAMEKITQGIAVSLNVDTRDFVSMVDSVNALRKGELDKVKHETVMPYASWDEFVADAESDPDAKRLLNLVVSGKAHSIAYTLRTYRSPKNAMVTFTTAHKCKGLEWDQVVIANDFPSNYDKEGNWVGLDEAERNLLYVAHTRPRKALQWNSTVQEMLELKVLSEDKKAFEKEEEMRSELARICDEEGRMEHYLSYCKEVDERKG